MRGLGVADFFNRRGSFAHDAVMGLLSLLLAVIVFYIDTFTSIESAIAVLYVIVLLFAGQIMTRDGILWVAALCCALTVFSYLFTHGLADDIPILLRAGVSLAAVVTTAVLLLRNEAAHEELVGKNLALQESEVRYRAIFDQTRVALWERDYSRARAYLMELKADGVTNLREYLQAHPEVVSDCMGLVRTVAANEAAKELLGPSAGDPTGLRKLIVPTDPFVELLIAIFSGDKHLEGKSSVITDAGETKLVLISISFPEDPAAFDRVVLGMIDITQRELTQQALVEARAELTRAARAATAGALSASLAHELNQPLGAIVLNAQTLLRWLDRDPPDLAAVRRSAERMIRDSGRTSDIIQNTRSLLAQGERKAEWVDLPRLVEETRALMEHDFQRGGVSFETAGTAAIPRVKAVRIELQQVLINLMTNAVQAMAETPAGGRSIRIALESRDEETVAIAVRDTGPGLSEDAIGKIFAPFYTTKGTGMGMGLSICRSILEAGGGKLEAFNHAGGGAVFEMTLPIEDKHA
jgi:signal transduction histidine kinase